MTFLFKTTLIITDEAKSVLKSAGFLEFHDFMDYSGGKRICHKRGRSTVRLQIGDRAFYLKRNRFHWVEFLKGLSRLRLPPRGALREWCNIAKVKQAGIATVPPIAFGERPIFGLETCSFSMTEELYGSVPLDQVLRDKFSGTLSGAELKLKRQIFRQIGSLARRLHIEGLFHQDLYLSHFFLSPKGSLQLIDLQRILCRPLRARHFRIKDLAQLNYSASRITGISRADRLRFLLAYLDRNSLLDEDKTLVRAVQKKTDRIARHDVKLLARRRRRGELP